jgi:NTE family protein
VPGGCELGLALSGGGARGLAHIGVLEVLEEHGVVPDCIAGASMGSVVGALYASGHSIAEIREIVGVVTWRDIYAEPQDRRQQPIVHRIEQQRSAVRLGLDNGALRLPRAVLDDARLNQVLIEHLAPAGFAAGRNFDELAIPFRTVGTDLRSGRRIVLARGDLAKAVRSSMSVPLAYPPVAWEDALLVDGGLVENVPVRLAQEMGAEFVLAVDVSTPVDPEVIPDMLGVTLRIIDLLFSAYNNRFELEPELEILPNLEGHSFADYSNIDELIARGREAAEAVVERIPDRFKGRDVTARLAGHAHDMGNRTVRAVELASNQYLADSVLLREFRVRRGEPLDFPAVLDDLSHMLSTGLLKGAWLDVVDAGDQQVTLNVRVDEQYRNTLDVGLAYQSADQAQALLRFETRDLFGGGSRLQLDGLASARDLELSARLRGEGLLGGHVGYAIDLTLHDEKPKYYVNDEFLNRAKFKRRGVGLGVSVPFSLNHLLTAGIRVGAVTTTEELGVDIPTGKQNQRLLVGGFVWDTLSSWTLPDSGRLITAAVGRSEPGLGATFGYWRLQADYHEAFRIGPLITQVRALYGYSGDDLPASEQFRLGGPELVPGLAREQLWGDQALAASLQLGFEPVSIARVYVRVGAGNVWAEPSEIALSDLRLGVGLGTAVATPVGPLVFDYAWLEGGGTRLYFAFGWQ